MIDSNWVTLKYITFIKYWVMSCPYLNHQIPSNLFIYLQLFREMGNSIILSQYWLICWFYGKHKKSRLHITPPPTKNQHTVSRHKSYRVPFKSYHVNGTFAGRCGKWVELFLTAFYHLAAVKLYTEGSPLVIGSHWLYVICQ